MQRLRIKIEYSDLGYRKILAIVKNFKKINYLPIQLIKHTEKKIRWM